MLQVSHGCPVCGQVHEGRKYGFKHPAPRECPLVIVGDFPVISLPPPPDGIPVKVPAAHHDREDNDGSRNSESLIAESLRQAEFARSRGADRSRGLGVPWLPPPDLGEVL